MKEIGERTVIAAVVHFLCCIVGVQGQIGVTTCTFSTQAFCYTSLPNSYCNLASLLCECATEAGYVENSDGSGCDYNCGAPAAPENGSVDTTQGTLAGDVATYSCNNGYKVAGTSTTTCVQDVGWDNTAAACVKGEIGDDCTSDASLCGIIAFGYCQGTCKCSLGYEDDGTSQNCQDINECKNPTCQNGATCVDEINRYTCICSPGYDGTYCTNDIDECVSNPCQNGATCNDLINSYSCTCVDGYTGEHCQTNCEMVVASETEIGIQKPAPYSIHSVSSLSACENLCLSDAKCKEASFLSGSNLFCALYDTSLHDPVIDDKMNEEDKHLQKVCYKGCGSTNSIPNGEITLDSGNTSYGALAAVTCFSGYEADTESVICLEMGNWTNARCLPKDCGEPYKILHGTITTLVRGSTTFGAKANVVCDPGYQVKNSATSVTETDAGTISCLVTGKWEEVYCSAKDQNDAGDSSTILVIILACSLTAAVSIALTTVALFVYRKYKRVKLSTPTSNPEPAVYYNAAVTDNLEGTGADNNQYEHLNVTRETETN